MRTLQLTHEEIAIIQRALGIAEVTFNNLRKNYIDQVVNVRGIDNKTKAIQEVEHIFNIENQFADLLISIKNSEKDV